MRVIDLLADEETGGEEAHMSLYTAKQARQEAVRYLHTVADRLRKSSVLAREVSITCLVPTGVGVASAILKQTGWSREARETDQCHLVVMATHGHEEKSPLNLGSVAEHIVNETFHPLLLVPPEETVVRPVEPLELANHTH